jgi:hypothetical protein
MDVKNRFYLYGQFVGHGLGGGETNEETLGDTLRRGIFGEDTPEATILQTQLFLTREGRKAQELMALAIEGANHPKDTSADLYLDPLDQKNIDLLGKFIQEFGESGFSSAVAREQIMKNLNGGPFAVQAAYARYYVHRYTLSLESKEGVLDQLCRLRDATSESRIQNYWKILEQTIQSS